MISESTNVDSTIGESSNAIQNMSTTASGTDTTAPLEAFSDTTAADASSDTDATSATAVVPPKVTVPLKTPSFRVNDNSRIEITMYSHEFETSMAKNDFSSHSTEGSM